MNIFRQSIQHYAKGSNTNVIIMFSVVALIAAGLTFLYVFFIGRHHQDNLLAVFFLFGAIISFILTLVMLLWPY